MGKVEHMRLSSALTIAVGIGLAVVYFLAQPLTDLLVPLTDGIFVVVSGFCALFAFAVFRIWKGEFRSIHAGLFLAVLSWFLGETAWSVYELVLQIPIPYPSLADVFYLVGYAPAAIGMILFLFKVRGLTWKTSLIGALSGLLVIGFTYAFLVNPLEATQSDSVTKLFDVAYPILDSVLLTLGILMFLTLRGGRIAASWIWISSGLLLTGVGDIVFSLGTLEGWYYSGHPVELLYLWGYLALIAGFDSQRAFGSRNS